MALARHGMALARHAQAVKDGININTVDAFQGKENDIVIFSVRRRRRRRLLAHARRCGAFACTRRSTAHRSLGSCGRPSPQARTALHRTIAILHPP